MPPAPDPIRVLLCDDHAVVREGLERLLANAERIEVVGAASDGQDGLELALRTRPDVILMDLSMPRLDGIAATRAIVAELPETRIIMLTSFGESQRVLDAIDAGAVGYLLKDSDGADVGPGRAGRGGRRLAARPASRPRRDHAQLGPEVGAHAAGARRPRAALVRALEQGDRDPARHLRGDREGAPDAHLPADRRDRPHAGGALGTRPGGPADDDRDPLHRRRAGAVRRRRCCARSARGPRTPRSPPR